MPKFVIDLGDVKLPKKLEDTIAADLQRVVLGHVARSALEAPVALKIPKDWLGLILRRRMEEVELREAHITKALDTIRG